MATVLSFAYQGFRVLCTALPARGGGFRATARITTITPDLSREDTAQTLHGGVHCDASLAIDTACSLAKTWIEARTH
jgi:hypothetical protein